MQQTDRAGNQAAGILPAWPGPRRYRFVVVRPVILSSDLSSLCHETASKPAGRPGVYETSCRWFNAPAAHQSQYEVSNQHMLPSQRLPSGAPVASFAELPTPRLHCSSTVPQSVFACLVNWRAAGRACCYLRPKLHQPGSLSRVITVYSPRKHPQLCQFRCHRINTVYDALRGRAHRRSW